MAGREPRLAPFARANQGIWQPPDGPIETSVRSSPAFAGITVDRLAEVLAQEQEEAASKEQVLKALDSGSVRMRGKLGESLSSVQKYATPVEATIDGKPRMWLAKNVGQICLGKGPFGSHLESFFPPGRSRSFSARKDSSYYAAGMAMVQSLYCKV